MHCLFLPDNLHALLCQEQQMLQEKKIIACRKSIPYCPVTKEITDLHFLPPSIEYGLVVRKERTSGNLLILGNADLKSAQKLTAVLQPSSKKNTLFGEITSRRWYSAEFELNHNTENNTYTWTIKNRQWHKANT